MRPILLLLLLCAHASSYSVLQNTDWIGGMVSDDPVFPSANSLEACVQICSQRPDCVAVSWSSPSAPKANANLCSLKCAARLKERISSQGQLAVILRNQTTCPGPGWYPDEWQRRITQASLLLAGPKEPGAHIGNGYVATFIKINLTWTDFG